MRRLNVQLSTLGIVELDYEKKKKSLKFVYFLTS